MSEQTITADRLNATHLGKRVTLANERGTIMSGTLKKFETRLENQPVFTSDVCFTSSTGFTPVLRYETRACIVLHLSNQFNDDIAATVNGDKELRIEEEG
jgi:hypothetical protein